MKTPTLLALLTIAIPAIPAFGQLPETPSAREKLPNPPPAKTWKMIWNDEFDGTELDTTKWGHRKEEPRKGGVWLDKAVSLDGQGHLVMSVIKDGATYATGNIVSTGKFEHAFGFYVAKVQFQKQPGSWSAFWLTGGKMVPGSDGRDGTEIDIFEKPTLDDQIAHNLHWSGYGAEHQHAGQTVKKPGLMSGWHNVGLWWSPEQYFFYVDGHETWRTTAGGVCQVPLYLLFSSEIGSWAGDIKKARLPDKFFVDYVRVYDLIGK